MCVHECEYVEHAVTKTGSTWNILLVSKRCFFHSLLTSKLLFGISLRLSPLRFHATTEKKLRRRRKSTRWSQSARRKIHCRNKTSTTTLATCKFMFELTHFVLCDFKLYMLFHIMITIIIRCSSGYFIPFHLPPFLALSRAPCHSKNTQRVVCKRQYIL